MSEKEWIILGILYAIFLIVCVSIVIHKYKKAPNKELPHGEWVDIEPEILTMHARVADMCCFTETVGTQSPRLVQNFLVFFEDDGGEIHKIAVDEEIYCGFEVGQVGELTIIDGRISGYVLDGE